MIIRRIHIASFGPLVDFDCELYSGMNVIRGDNESGKTSLAMFIKFIFYGLSGRSVDNAPSERKKYVNWDTGYAEGYIIAAEGDREYRIERSLSVSTKPGSDKETVRESLTVTDTATGGRVSELEECPGAVLFGVPEQVFVNTVFSGQSGRSRIDGADTAAAVENLLFSADETVSVKKAAERLEKYRRNLMHKKGSGGEIPQMREKCADLRNRLEIASAHAAEIIDLDNAKAVHENVERELVSNIEWQTSALKYYEAEKLMALAADAKRADAAVSVAATDLKNALSLCCEHTKLDEARKLAASIEGERSGAAEFQDRLREFEVGAAALVNPDSVETPDDAYKRFKKKSSALGVFTTFGVITAVLTVVAGVGTAVLYMMKQNIFFITLAAAVLMLLLSILFFALRGLKISQMRRICAAFGVEDEDGLIAAVQYEISKRNEADILSRRADSVRMSLEQSGMRIEGLETEARAVAASFEDCCKAESRPSDGMDPLERLRAAIALAEKRIVAAEGLRAAYETASAIAKAKWERVPKDKLAIATEYIKSTEHDEKFPSNEESADEIKNAMTFNQAKLDALRKKIGSINVDLAAKRAVADSPAVLWEELSDSTEKLRQMTLDHDAVLLAAETLAEAGENMRRGIIPKIVRRSSVLFSDATDGRYSALGSGSAFQLSAVIGEHTKDARLLSSGTEDLAYICLRIALANELFGEKRPPLVFDESLAFMDPERSVAAKDALANSGHQVLLFTCRPEDAADPTLKMQRRG